jgi:hypothetical protein
VEKLKTQLEKAQAELWAATKALVDILSGKATK